MGESPETNAQRIALAKWAHRKKDFVAVVNYVEALNKDWLDTETEQLMNQLLIDAYIYTEASVKAKETIHEPLKKSALSETTRISKISVIYPKQSSRPHRSAMTTLPMQ